MKIVSEFHFYEIFIFLTEPVGERCVILYSTFPNNVHTWAKKEQIKAHIYLKIS